MSPPRTRGSSGFRRRRRRKVWFPAFAPIHAHISKGHALLPPQGEGDRRSRPDEVWKAGERPCRVRSGVRASLPTARRRSTPHPSRFARHLPRFRGEGARGRRTLVLAQRTDPSSVGFADIFSRAREKGRIRRHRERQRRNPDLANAAIPKSGWLRFARHDECGRRRARHNDRGRGEGSLTSSAAGARWAFARWRRRRRGVCGIRRASRGSRRSPGPSARRCRPASPPKAAGSLRWSPARRR